MTVPMERFPEDFVFRLTAEEKTELVTNCDRFVRALKGEPITLYRHHAGEDDASPGADDPPARGARTHD